MKLKIHDFVQKLKEHVPLEYYIKPKTIHELNENQ